MHYHTITAYRLGYVTTPRTRFVFFNDVQLAIEDLLKIYQVLFSFSRLQLSARSVSYSMIPISSWKDPKDLI